MKIGIDVHGVADTLPEIFTKFSTLSDDIEIHIITGGSITPKFKNQIDELGIAHKHVFSITDSLVESGENVRWADSENPWFDEELWNKAKADYCDRVGIDIMFDDTIRYAKYFENIKTTFVLLKKIN